MGKVPLGTFGVFISCALKLMHGAPNFYLKKLWALKVISCVKVKKVENSKADTVFGY